MNTKNSSWRETEGDLQQEFAEGTEFGERGQLGARRMGLVLRPQKAKAHLSPRPVASQARHESVAREETFAARIVVPQPKRAGGEGEGLGRLVLIKRLDGDLG